MTRAPRIGVIGARRARDGLGPFVVRDLRAAGAEVPCFLATRAETRDAARAELERIAGGPARGFLRLEEMLETQALDALAILSPHESHLVHLEAALAAGLHALCEKPLIWGTERPHEAVASLVSRFAARGLALWENCQWHCALPAFAQLHPGHAGSPTRRFAMSLQPPPGGARMLADALPHPLSLLQALAPDPRPSLADIRVTFGGGDGVELAFVYRTAGAEVAARVELRPTRSRPRDVWFEIDGLRARREVGAGYRLCLTDADRSVPLDDPLSRHLAHFVGALTHGGDAPEGRGQEIAARAQLLSTLVEAWKDAAP